MKHYVDVGQTDYTVLIKILDSSSSTGAGKTGLTASDLNAYYTRVETDNDVTITAISLSDLSALTDAHTDGGILEVSSSNAPGLYRIDLPDGVFLSGAWSAVISITDAGSNDVASLDLEFQLTTPSLRLKKNVAFNDFMFAMFDSNGDPATGLTITAARIIDGGSLVSCSNNASEIGSGVYKIDLAASDLNGNNIMFSFSASGAKTTLIHVVTVD